MPTHKMNRRGRSVPSNRRRRLTLEGLETRLAPALFTVTSAADSGVGTLRQAILDAATNNEADTITFDPGLTDQTITLTSDDPNTAFGPTALVISGDDITIDGSDAPHLQISGNDTRRIFAVGSDASLTLQNLTLTGGRAQGGNGGSAPVLGSGGGGGGGLGGAVYVYGGTLNLMGVTLAGNTAKGGNGGNGNSSSGTYSAGGGGAVGGDGGEGGVGESSWFTFGSD